MPRSPDAEAKDSGPIVAGDLAGRMTDRQTLEWTGI